MSRRGLERLARAAILIQVGLFAFFVAGSHNAFVRLPRPTTTDFSSFYAAGRLADEGRAAAAYDRDAHRRMVQAVTSPDIEYRQYFLNPPPFLLICAPLARLPYLAAFILFEVLTGVFWLAVAARIAGGGRLVLLLLGALPALYWAVGWGQNSFLTAGLMGLGTLLLQRRPFAAGATFGLLAIKPHFGILLPVALICGRYWRAIAGAAASCAALCAISAIVFGIDCWRGFFAMALHARNTIESGQIQFAGHIDPGGAARLLGLGAPAGWAIQAACSLAAAAVVAVIWRHRRPAPGAAEAENAALVAGTLLAMPFLLFYDLVMGSIAACWLAAAARRTGWRGGEGAAFAIVYLMALLDFPSAELLRLAVGCLAAPLLLFLAARRVWAPMPVQAAAPV
jgi:alpha-1,2-mannosyltransferase